MDEIKQETLVRCGLTKNETKVYLALLKLGSATAVEITKQSKVHRVNVYDALERLMQKGLIATITQAKKRIYEVGSPDHLNQLLNEKQEALNKIMPSLKEEFKSKKEKQQVYQFFGPEGVMQAYYMMIESGNLLYGVGGSGLNRKYLKHRHEMWNKERIKKGVKGKVLYYESVRGIKEKSWKDPTVKIKYLPDKFKSLGMIDICGDLIVNLVPKEGNITAIVIENKILAETYKKFFDFIWEFANP